MVVFSPPVAFILFFCFCALYIYVGVANHQPVFLFYGIRAFVGVVRFRLPSSSSMLIIELPGHNIQLQLGKSNTQLHTQPGAHRPHYY